MGYRQEGWSGQKVNRSIHRSVILGNSLGTISVSLPHIDHWM
jgi:hypothetical protein